MRLKGLPRKFAPVLIAALLALTLAACGGGQEEPQGNAPEKTGQESGASATTEDTGASGGASEETTSGMEKTSEQASALQNAKIGPREITNMTPADGKPSDPPQPLPKDPPKGVKLFPATTNETREGKIEYDRDPPTNGDHSPIWQNCGFYSKPIDNRTAVHSMDHGVVWITYRPNLPAAQVQKLRSYGDEDYVIVSPYPGLPAPVIATAWRVQLRLDGADDPRLRQFVDQFRISELAPLSGNRCIGGVGEPE
ncbi:MAG TPA: DUF3105 domain-containing protein [Rubrobacteraceae bacterium]|nr:DUF3105 domain-containing protein [Rubrobacteraceae bacterium]